MPPQQAPDIYITDQIIRRPYHIPKKRLAYTEDYNKGSRLEKTILFPPNLPINSHFSPLFVAFTHETNHDAVIWLGYRKKGSRGEGLFSPPTPLLEG